MADKQNFYLPHEKQIVEYIKTIEHLKKQNRDNPLFTSEIMLLEDKLEKLQASAYQKLSSWDRVLISRHPQRPHTIDYVQNICDNFIELFGDRVCSDDAAIIGGFATIDGMRCVLVGQEKGDDTESRMRRNFGMVNPEGFRKALRLMKLAEKYGLPIVSLLDTPGAYPGLEAEQRGQGWVIAENLRAMSQLNTPIVAVVIGEGCSGGALGMGVADVVAMLEHSYYSVISPEGCASILWKDAGKKQQAAEALKLNAEFLHENGIVDDIISEPLGGAHHNKNMTYDAVKGYIGEKLRMLLRICPELLLEQRYAKFRSMGAFIEKAHQVGLIG